jgi:integrase
MSQAKILTSTELRRVLDHISTRPHAERNRAMVLCSHLAGMRVKEIAALRYSDVVNADGTIKDEIYLSRDRPRADTPERSMSALNCRRKSKRMSQQFHRGIVTNLYLSRKNVGSRDLVRTGI